MEQEDTILICKNCGKKFISELSRYKEHCGKKCAYSVRECEVCGREFYPKVTSQKYCSDECRLIKTALGRANPENAIAICKNCGIEFAPGSGGYQEYCCKRCAYDTRKCEVCGNKYRPIITSQKYCSDECKQIAIENYFGKEYARGRWIIFNRDKFACFYCGKKSYEEGSIELHVDHIIPRKDGGVSTASNLVTACQRCNLEKSATRIYDEKAILNEVAKRNRRADICPELVIKLESIDEDSP